MELNLDPDKFNEYQTLFIKEIIETIRLKLIEAGLEGEDLHNATASIGMSVAAIIDSMADIETEDGEQVKPYLAFQEGEDALLHLGENSYTYERSYNVLRTLFKV